MKRTPKTRLPTSVEAANMYLHILQSSGQPLVIARARAIVARLTYSQIKI